MRKRKPNNVHSESNFGAFASKPNEHEGFLLNFVNEVNETRKILRSATMHLLGECDIHVTKPRKQPRSDTPPLGSSEPCFIFQEAPQLKISTAPSEEGVSLPFYCQV
jgi:hypothetical protein